jgi:hypothetical protein
MKRILRSLIPGMLAATMLSATAPANPLPFEISIDGQRVDGAVVGSTSPAAPVNSDGVEGVDIQVKYTGMQVQPILNVSTVPPRVAYGAGETVSFLMSLNYAAFVERAEIQIYQAGRRSASGLYKTLEVGPSGAVEWVMPADAPADMEYLVRVYDPDGRFDETRPLPLIRHRLAHPDAEPPTGAVAPGYSEDFTAVRNIGVTAGAVTVYGNNIPADHDVIVMGEPVPVDSKGCCRRARVRLKSRC